MRMMVISPSYSLTDGRMEMENNNPPNSSGSSSFTTAIAVAVWECADNHNGAWPDNMSSVVQSFVVHVVPRYFYAAN